MVEKINKISTGIVGLDKITYGGLIENSVNIVIGSAGTGKTLFCIQFLLEGLLRGDHGLYISLDQSKEEIMLEAVLMGWDEIHQHINAKKLYFYEFASGELLDYVKRIFPDILKYKNEFKIKTRVTIDPLTPVIWKLPSNDEKREFLNFMFKTLRKIGTSVLSVEIFGENEKIIDTNAMLPMYLADSIFFLQYLGVGEEYNRSMRIIKMRGSRHSEDTIPLQILKGLGVVLIPPGEKVSENLKEADALVDDAIRQINRRYQSSPFRNFLIKRLLKFKASGVLTHEQVISTFLESYSR
jgi:KaiC/GvpD/RAD55 family RecA-like ATPase